MANKPKSLGSANLLAEVGELVDRWGVTRQAAFRLLRALHVPLLHITNEAYFNMYALEKVIYYLSRHGATGFSAPGSDYKNKDRAKMTHLGDTKVEITDKDIKVMATPLFIAEWQAMGSGAKPAAVTNYTSILRQTHGKKK